MTRFVGTHQGKLDRKGRISVPAKFRAALDAADTKDIVAWPSHQYPCIEARSTRDFEALVRSIQELPRFSPEREAFEAGIIADSHELRVDGDGRMVLPEELIAGIGLTESVTFLGKGDRFEIWDSATSTAHLAAAKADARARRYTLSSGPIPPSGPLPPTPDGVQ
jgi:MraZ protein